MNPTDSIFHRALITILTEVFDGPPGSDAYLLNPGDPGLLKQLDSISAADASARPMAGKTTIASHVDHVWYGLSLLNRWAGGEENPFATSDWEASWKRTTVTDEQWRELREKLRREATAWREHVASRGDWQELWAAGAISSAAHTAYHFGAIRQILAALNK